MSWLLSLIVGVVVSAVILLLVDRLDIGVRVESFGTAIIAAVVIALLNATIGRVLQVSLNVLTLCLLSWLIGWIVNAFVIYVAARLVRGFEVYNYISAIIAAAVISLLHWGIDYLVGMLS